MIIFFNISNLTPQINNIYQGMKVAIECYIESKLSYKMRFEDNIKRIELKEDRGNEI